MFSERKVAQMAAFFLDKRGGCMSHLKLMKLLYLADRESLAQFGAPISGDSPVAMPHGPVLSMTLDLMDGNVRPSQDGWDAWVTAKENYEVSLARSLLSRDELDELSDNDIDTLSVVWDRFGQMDRWAIRDYTHDHCPEWKDPQGSSAPIGYDEIFRALGRSAEQSAELAKCIETQKALDRQFVALNA